MRVCPLSAQCKLSDEAGYIRSSLLTKMKGAKTMSAKMTKETLKKLIQTASGTVPAETVIKNCKVIKLFTGEWI